MPDFASPPCGLARTLSSLSFLLIILEQSYEVSNWEVIGRHQASGQLFGGAPWGGGGAGDVLRPVLGLWPCVTLPASVLVATSACLRL